MSTSVLFVYFPSFNTAMMSGSSNESYRASVNTYLSLIGSIFVSIAMNRRNKEMKTNVQIMMKATLSGGVVIGAVCDKIEKPAIALFIGIATGLIVTLIWMYAKKQIEKKLKMHDTQSVMLSYGVPALIGSFLSIVYPSDDVTIES
jgi:ammonium transporter Rh